MNRSNISEDNLVQINKGTKVLFKDGQVIDSLTVLAYKGKQYVKSRGIFEAVYEVECECGNRELRRHVYLANDTSVNGKCCFECARINSSRNLTSVKRGRPRKDKSKEENKEITKNDEYYQNIVKKIFETPIKESMHVHRNQ